MSSNARNINLSVSAKSNITFNAAGGKTIKFNSLIWSSLMDSSGNLLVGGGFTNYAGVSGRSYLIRLNSDGSLDTSFCTNAADGSKFNNGVRPLAIDSNGKILVGGNFTNYAGVSGRNRLVRLNSDGTLDTSIDFSDNVKITPTSICINEKDNYFILGLNFTLSKYGAFVVLDKYGNIA